MHQSSKNPTLPLPGQSGDSGGVVAVLTGKMFAPGGAVLTNTLYVRTLDTGALGDLTCNKRNWKLAKIRGFPIAITSIVKQLYKNMFATVQTAVHVTARVFRMAMT